MSSACIHCSCKIHAITDRHSKLFLKWNRNAMVEWLVVHSVSAAHWDGGNYTLGGGNSHYTQVTSETNISTWDVQNCPVFLRTDWENVFSKPLILLSAQNDLLAGTGAGRGHKALPGPPAAWAGLDGWNHQGGCQSKGSEPNAAHTSQTRHPARSD